MMDDTRSRENAAVPAVLSGAPGYQVRRLYQAYLAVWGQQVDPVLTGPQFAVLQCVDANPGWDQRSIARLVALDTSTMADVAKRLEDRGLLDRRASTHDGRRKLLYSTREGVKVLRAANKRARALDKLLLEQYSEEERAQLIDTLRSLADLWEMLAGVA